MQSIKSIILEYFYDTLYEAEVIMRSDRDKNITIITDNLRGVCGITVCTIVGPAKAVSPKVEKTYSKVKFFQLGATLQEHLQRMSIDARKIDGVHSFVAYRANKVRSRIYRS